MVGQFWSRFEDGTVDFAETGALIADAGLSSRREYERWGIRRIRNEWCSTGSDHQARHRSEHTAGA
jgi:hypothetical protein